LGQKERLQLGSRENLSADGASIGTTGGEACLPLNLNKEILNQPKLLGSFQKWKIWEFHSKIQTLNQGLKPKRFKIQSKVLKF
jgi:hypothetical protein